MRGSYIASKLIQVFINFNSRLYMRGSSLPQMEVPTLKYFNSRLYMRGSDDEGLPFNWSSLFQFTPLHERQRRFRELRGHHAYFNSRLYMRGSGPALESYGTRYIFQFTPLHERQPCCRVPHLVLFGISIHASTWEAARQASRHVDALTISIHASTWEAASSAFFSSFWSAFQFTPLHERQQVRTLILFVRFLIFQFTPLHERQHISTPTAQVLLYFNSRLYMRGSEKPSRHAESSRTFQFTPLHERQQGIRQQGPEDQWISIHASTWEAAAKIHNFFNKIDTIFYQTLFFYSNFSEGSPFFNSSSIFLINCIFLPAPMSHKKMYESHQRTHF